MKKIFLLFAITMSLSVILISCGPDEQAQSNCTIDSAFLQGSWYVTYFWDSGDFTDAYDNYNFEANNGEFNARLGSDVFEGSVDIQSTNHNGTTCSVLDIVFEADPVLDELTEEWIVTGISEDLATIELLEMISNNPQEIMHLTRD